MQSISCRLQRVNYSQTIAMSAKTRFFKKKGINIINLSIGEPNFFPPSFIFEGVKNAINYGHHYYTAVSGYSEIREVICEKFLKDNSLNYKPSQIVVSSGVKQAISNLFLSLLNPGDEVIIQSPFWMSYYEMAIMCEAKPIVIHTFISTNFKIVPEHIMENITMNTKIFVFSSPCNPTGYIYNYKELKNLSEVFIKYPQLIIISDEIYEYINYSENQTSLGTFTYLNEQLVTLNGLSKAFSIPGWRIGYIGAPEWLAKTCEKVQGQITSGLNALTQQAAAIALKSSAKRIIYMIEEFRRRRDLLLRIIKEIPDFYIENSPEGAFYLFPNVEKIFGNYFLGIKISNVHDLSIFLLEKAQVATVSGISFGEKKCLRISYSVPEKLLKEAFKRIKRILS